MSSFKYLGLRLQSDGGTVGPNSSKNGKEQLRLCISTWTWFGKARLQNSRLTLLLYISKSPTLENETISILTGPDRHGMEWLSNENGLVRQWKCGYYEVCNRCAGKNKPIYTNIAPIMRKCCMSYDRHQAPLLTPCKMTCHNSVNSKE